MQANLLLEPPTLQFMQLPAFITLSMMSLSSFFFQSIKIKKKR